MVVVALIFHLWFKFLLAVYAFSPKNSALFQIVQTLFVLKFALLGDFLNQHFSHGQSRVLLLARLLDITRFVFMHFVSTVLTIILGALIDPKD